VSQQLRWPVILFDLDGTLANSIDLIVGAFTSVFRDLVGRELSRAEICRWIGEPLLKTMQREAPDQADELWRTYRAYHETHLADIVGYPGLPELLAELNQAGAVTGVVTAKRHDASYQTMTQAGVVGLIDLVVAMEDTSAHKPDPEPLLVAAAKLAASPETCVYVGDSIYDIQAARAAGMAVIAVTWGAGTEEDLNALKPDATCASASALRDTLILSK